MFDLLFGFDPVVTAKSQRIGDCHHSIVMDMVKAEFFPVHTLKAHAGMDM
jgi:hypothetical protein